MGLAHGKLGDAHKAVEYHKEYLAICQKTGDAIGEGHACAALAQNFKELGDISVAISFLDNYLDFATRTNQSAARAHACSALGAIYNEQVSTPYSQVSA